MGFSTFSPIYRLFLSKKYIYDTNQSICAAKSSFARVIISVRVACFRNGNPVRSIRLLCIPMQVAYFDTRLRSLCVGCIDGRKL